MIYLVTNNESSTNFTNQAFLQESYYFIEVRICYELTNYEIRIS